MNPTNITAIETKNYKDNDEIPVENDRIAKEIDKLKKYTCEYSALKIVKD